MAGNIIFDQPMDEGLLPTVETFTITSDGVPLVTTPIAWISPTELQCNTTGNPPAATAYVKQNVLDPLCVSALGTFARPQSNVQWFP